MNTVKLCAMLTSTLDGITVWSDFVPEKRPLPAVAYSHITSGYTGRLLKGDKRNPFDSWRIVIVGETRSECETIQALLIDLDLSKFDGYKKIEILSDGYIASNPDDNTYSYYVDLKTYEV